jgi:hypothetical protein
MTVPQQGPPLVDQGNTLLNHVPARMDSGTVDIPGTGKLGVLTIRTGSTTLTIMLSAADLRDWAGIMSGLADQMTGGLVKATPIDIAALSQELRQSPPGFPRRGK